MKNLSDIKAVEAELPDPFQMDWQPIATAPFDRDLQLAVLDTRGSHALVFPCRRVLHGWAQAVTRAPVTVHPTHWRVWHETAIPPFSRGSAS
jgi:hypothetical protein